MRILFIGDIVGRPGRRVLRERLDELKKENKLDFIIANCENAAGGFGLTRKVYDELRDMGIDVLTSGNHIWDKKEVYNVIAGEERLLRPLNFPPKAPGRGKGIFSIGQKGNIGVINLAGRIFMDTSDCPFRTLEEHIAAMRKVTPIIVVDFHAEASSEKRALFHFAKGKVSAVLGTHTHVTTADEQVSSEGTAYITDVGMTGFQDGVLGIDPETIVNKFITGLPQRFEIQKGDGEIRAVFIDVDGEGRVQDFKRIRKSSKNLEN